MKTLSIFNSHSQEPAPAPVLQARAERAYVTLVGAGTRFHGKLEVKGEVLIEGAVHGDVIAQAGEVCAITVGECGRVQGTLNGSTIQIAGIMRGMVYCDGLLSLSSKADVDATLHYKHLEIASGAKLRGALKQNGPDLGEKTLAVVTTTRLEAI